METPSGELPQIQCLLRDSLPLDQEEVGACFDPDRFARKTNPAQEEAIASQWRRASRANPRLFNGSKFRYAGVRWPDRPEFQLGLTSYREHVGTNLRSGQKLLQEAGSAVHGDRQAFLADPLAVGAILLTSDNRLVLIRRALWVGEYPGRVDRPGGHAEPDELPRPAPSGEEPPAEERHEAALSEVFESVRREVRDELGVPLTHLSRAYLAGILRDRQLGGRPTLEFIIRCSLPSSELERLYNEGKHCEADESLGLVLLTRDELFSEKRAVFRVPDLAEVDVEFPWRRAAPENGTAAGAGAAEDGPAAAAQGNGEGAAAATGAVSCGEGTEAVVNCDVSAPPQPVLNCETAAAAAAAAVAAAAAAAVAAAATEVKCEATPAPEPAADPPPPAAQPPAAKPRQQPPKKRRRNRKDKRGAGRAEAPPSVTKEADPVPTPATEPVTQAESAGQVSVQPAPETRSESTVPSGAAASAPNAAPTPADSQQTSRQNAVSDPQTSDRKAPAASAEVPASSAAAAAPSEVGKSSSADAEVPSSDAGHATTAAAAAAAAATAAEAAATAAAAAAAAAATTSTATTATASASSTAIVASTAASTVVVAASTAAAAAEPAGGDSDEIVVVQQNGVVLLRSGGEVTETTMPAPSPSSAQIETHAEVVNNPEGAEVAAGAAAEADKTLEELEREKKAQLWEQMTPGCQAALMLLKAANLKGFVFRF